MVEQTRAPLRLNEGTPGLTNCTYLESLGFTQIFLADFVEVKVDQEILKYNTRNHTVPAALNDDIGSQYDTAYDLRKPKEAKKFKTFGKFRVQTNFKKVSLYLTKDSNKTLGNILTCLNSTLQQEPRKNNKDRPEPEEMTFATSRDGHNKTNESLGEMSHSSNISNIFESILKDYSQVNNDNPKEGLPDFENIPHKVSMAP